MAKNPDRHYEHPDPTPMAVPAGFKRPLTLAEQVRRLVRSERFQQEMERQGFETFEEADDFDIEDDPVDPSTPFEPFFDPALGREVTPHDLLRNPEPYRRETEKRVEAAKAAKKAKEEKEAAAATPLPVTPAAPSQEPEKPGS